MAVAEPTLAADAPFTPVTAEPGVMEPAAPASLGEEGNVDVRGAPSDGGVLGVLGVW